MWWKYSWALSINVFILNFDDFWKSVVIGDLIPSRKNLVCLFFLFFSFYLLETQEIFLLKTTRRIRFAHNILETWGQTVSSQSGFSNFPWFQFLLPLRFFYFYLLKNLELRLVAWRLWHMSAFLGIHVIESSTCPIALRSACLRQFADASTPCAILCTGQKRLLVWFSSYHCIVKSCRRIGTNRCKCVMLFYYSVGNRPMRRLKAWPCYACSS